MTRALREFKIPLKKVTPPLPPPPPLLILILHNFLSFSLRKKKEFCLDLKHLALESTPFQFTPYLSLPIFHLPSPFRPFSMWYQNLGGIFDSERMSSVPCKSRHKRNEARSHVVKSDKTLIKTITFQKKYQTDSSDIWYVERDRQTDRECREKWKLRVIQRETRN